MLFIDPKSSSSSSFSSLSFFDTFFLSLWISVDMGISFCYRTAIGFIMPAVLSWQVNHADWRQLLFLSGIIIVADHMQLREPEAILSKPLQSDKTRQTSDVLKLSGEWSRILHKRLRRGFFWRLAKRLLHFSVEVKLSEKQLPKIQAHTHGLCSKQARCFFCSFPKIWYDFKPSGTAKTARFGTLSNRRYQITPPSDQRQL